MLDEAAEAPTRAGAEASRVAAVGEWPTPVAVHGRRRVHEVRRGRLDQGRQAEATTLIREIVQVSGADVVLGRPSRGSDSELRRGTAMRFASLVRRPSRFNPWYIIFDFSISKYVVCVGDKAECYDGLKRQGYITEPASFALRRSQAGVGRSAANGSARWADVSGEGPLRLAAISVLRPASLEALRMCPGWRGRPGTTTMRSMVPRSGLRALAALTALTAGLAIPGLSIGHGVSHRRASHEHDVGGLRAHVHDHEHDDGARVEAGEDHEHPRLDQAPSARADAWGPAVVVRPEPALDPSHKRLATPRPRLSLPGPAPPGQPPPRLRAPPAA